MQSLRCLRFLLRTVSIAIGVAGVSVAEPFDVSDEAAPQIAPSFVNGVPVNDLCADAILIPREGALGWSSPGGVLNMGSTATATVDGDIGNYCTGLFPSSKGVWFKIIGDGNRVQVDTDPAFPGSRIDSRLKCIAQRTTPATT